MLAASFRWDLIVIAVIGAMGTYFAAKANARSKQNHELLQEVRPNGGASMRDAIDDTQKAVEKIAQRQDLQYGERLQDRIDDATWKGATNQKIETLITNSHQHRREDRPNEDERRGR